MSASSCRSALIVLVDRALRQHGVAEAVDHVGEFGEDRRVDVDGRVEDETSTSGWILRANSSNTRCWYCISVVKRAAWNRRSPSQLSRRSQTCASASWSAEQRRRHGSIRATR